MNQIFEVISLFLQESDYLGPNDVFKKGPNEKVLYSADNVVWIQDERREIFNSSKINSTGKLIISNERLFFQPKFFTSGSSNIIDVPLKSVYSSDYSFTMQSGLSRKLTIQHEDNPRPLVFSSKTANLKRAHEILSRITG